MMPFTASLTQNIEQTFTYSHAKNTHNCKQMADEYDPIKFFRHLLKKENPFTIFMELDRFAFKRARQEIIRYRIPYTATQERQARIVREIVTSGLREGERNEKYRQAYMFLRDTLNNPELQPWHKEAMELIEITKSQAMSDGLPTKEVEVIYR